MLLVCRLINRLILNVNQNLQSNFIGLLSLYTEEDSLTKENEIVFIILNACVQLITFNRMNPLLSELDLFSIDLFFLYFSIESNI